MRYFSPEWSACEDENQVSFVAKEYERYISTIPGELGRTIHRFTRFDARDALLDSLEILRAERVTNFNIIVGDEMSGYRRLSISYKDSNVHCSSIEDIQYILESRLSRIRYDEFDTGTKTEGAEMVHRFLLTSGYEFEISFIDMTWTDSMLRQRAYVSYGNILKIL